MRHTLNLITFNLLAKPIKTLHKITSKPKENLKSSLEKQSFWNVHIPPSREINDPHYDIPISSISLICFIYFITSSNETHITMDYLVMMLHQDMKLLKLLGPRKQVRLYLCWKQYIKMMVSLNTQKYFNAIMGLSLNVMRQSSLNKTMLIFL